MPSRREVRLRHAEHFLERLRAIEDLFPRGAAEAEEARKEFLASWPQIQAGQSWVGHQAADDDTAATLCSGYAGAAGGRGEMTSLLDLQSHPRERVGWLESGVDAARRLRDRQAEAVHLYDLGVAHGQAYEWERSIASLEESLRLFRAERDLRSEGVVRNALGYAYQLQHQPQKALEQFSQARALFRDLQQPADEVFTLEALGQTHRQLGELESADACVEEALAIVRGGGNLSGEVLLLKSLGDTCWRRGDTSRAMECYERALTVSQGISNPVQRDSCASALIGIGLAYVSLGITRGNERLESDLAGYRGIGNRLGEGFALLALGVAHRIRKDWPQSERRCEESLLVFQEMGNRLGEAYARFHRALGLSERGAWSRVRDELGEAVALFRAAGYRRGEADACWNIGLACDKQGLRDDAILWAEAALETYQQIAPQQAADVREHLDRWRAQ